MSSFNFLFFLTPALFYVFCLVLLVNLHFIRFLVLILVLVLTIILVLIPVLFLVLGLVFVHDQSIAVV